MERREYQSYQDHRQTNYNYKNAPRKRPYSEVDHPGGVNGSGLGNERPAHLFPTSSITPWCSREEWMDVYRQIAPVLAKPDEDALRSLNIEKLEHIINSCWARAWDVPQNAAVTTILVLEGLRAIRLSERNVVAAKDLAVGSMAIIRFVKVVSEPLLRGRDGGLGSSIVEVCRRFGVKPEVVRIRHDSSHSDMHEARNVEDALIFVADWLKRKYWDDEERRINGADHSPVSKASAKLRSEALRQQIRTDLLSLREAIHREAKAKKNWRKANRKQVETHFSAITELLNRSSFERLDVFTGLLADEFLSPSDVTLDKLGTSDEIHALRDSLPPGLPGISRNEWYFLVEHVLSFPGGGDRLLDNLAQLMGDQNPERDYLTCAWILCILVEIFPTNGKSSARIWDPVNFMAVAKRIISRPSRFALPVLERISKVGVSNQKELKFIQDIMKLCKAAYPNLDNWSAKSPRSSTNDENQNPVKTVEDVKKEITISSTSSDKSPFLKEPSRTSGVWRIDSDLSWKNLPIGVLPTKNGTKIDLYQSLLLPGTAVPKEATTRDS